VITRGATSYGIKTASEIINNHPAAAKKIWHQRRRKISAKISEMASKYRIISKRQYHHGNGMHHGMAWRNMAASK